MLCGCGGSRRNQSVESDDHVIDAQKDSKLTPQDLLEYSNYNGDPYNWEEGTQDKNMDEYPYSPNDYLMPQTEMAEHSPERIMDKTKKELNNPWDPRARRSKPQTRQQTYPPPPNADNAASNNENYQGKRHTDPRYTTQAGIPRSRTERNPLRSPREEFRQNERGMKSRSYDAEPRTMQEEEEYPQYSRAVYPNHRDAGRAPSRSKSTKDVYDYAVKSPGEERFPRGPRSLTTKRDDYAPRNPREDLPVYPGAAKTKNSYAVHMPTEEDFQQYVKKSKRGQSVPRSVEREQDIPPNSRPTRTKDGSVSRRATEGASMRPRPSTTKSNYGSQRAPQEQAYPPDPRSREHRDDYRPKTAASNKSYNPSIFSAASATSNGTQLTVPDETPTTSSRRRASAPSIIQQQLDAIHVHFITKIKPLCYEFMDDPPAIAKDRQKEHARLGELIMREGMLKYDAIDVTGDNQARERRKECVKEANKMLDQLDEVAARPVVENKMGGERGRDRDRDRDKERARGNGMGRSGHVKKHRDGGGGRRRAGPPRGDEGGYSNVPLYG